MFTLSGALRAPFMLLVLTAAMALSACVGTIPVVKAPSASLGSLQGSPLTTVTYKKPDFTAMTAGKAAFGLLGAAAMISAGNDIVEKNQVTDPADAIAAALAPAVQTKLQAAGTSSIQGHDVKGEAPAKLAKTAGSKGAVLDVRTIGWMFGYFPADWTHYRVQYTAQARLIDAASGKVLGQVPCTYVSDDEKTAPTYDQLLENEAALLKAKLAAAATTCSALIEKEMFGA